MDVKIFITRFFEAFSEKAELPIAMWYSDVQHGELKKSLGCMFKQFSACRHGETISFSKESIGCGGGKFYTGFIPIGAHIPKFVSEKEHYKETPEHVIDYISKLDVQITENNFLNFARIDTLNSFENIEGLIFFVTPDILTGLCSWIFWDNNESDAVCTLFNSGCSAIVTNTINENRKNGYRTFLGLLDPSVRPYFDKNELSLAIPMSRFKKMYETMPDTCLLNNVPAWNYIKNRINTNS